MKMALLCLTLFVVSWVSYIHTYVSFDVSLSWNKKGVRKRMKEALLPMLLLALLTELKVSTADWHRCCPVLTYPMSSSSKAMHWLVSVMIPIDPVKSFSWQLAHFSMFQLYSPFRFIYNY